MDRNDNTLDICIFILATLLFICVGAAYQFGLLPTVVPKEVAKSASKKVKRTEKTTTPLQTPSQDVIQAASPVYTPGGTTVTSDYKVAPNHQALSTSKGMVSVPPGDIHTLPSNKIVFNAPYDDKHTHHIKVINVGSRRIGWAIKTTNAKRLGVDPPCGVLDPKEPMLMAVSCDSFEFDSEDVANDRITIEWTNTPEGADAKQFQREWFQGDGMVRRKNLAIVYNP